MSYSLFYCCEASDTKNEPNSSIIAVFYILTMDKKILRQTYKKIRSIAVKEDYHKGLM
jgi:hypothetical protein